MTTTTFLDRDEIRGLTGRAHAKLQIAALQRMGVPFFVNDINRPVVARSAVEGRPGATGVAPKKPWVPRVLKAG
jgi:hypothetical protein